MRPATLLWWSCVLLACGAYRALPAAVPTPAGRLPADTVLVEAEAMDDLGGWVLDQQFMDQMGSPFVLAHGLGVPVRDAVSRVRFPSTGCYRVLVRTRDWVAPWTNHGDCPNFRPTKMGLSLRRPAAPGRFQVLVNGQPLERTLGTEGACWHWQEAGTVEVTGPAATVALRDLTGFEGRCDAILFTRDERLLPPNSGRQLAEFRRKLLGLPEKPADGGRFDLVVVGGGIAGMCATLGAARLGLSVALVQDRPVLGGNNSSEVRVWLGGDINRRPYPRVGDVVRELEPRAPGASPGTADMYEDDKRLALVRAEKNVTLLLGAA